MARQASRNGLRACNAYLRTRLETAPEFTSSNPCQSFAALAKVPCKTQSALCFQAFSQSLKSSRRLHSKTLRLQRRYEPLSHRLYFNSRTAAASAAAPCVTGGCSTSSGESSRESVGSCLFYADVRNSDDSS